MNHQNQRFYKAVAVGILLATVGSVSYLGMKAELLFTPRRLERHGDVNTEGTGVVRETKSFREADTGSSSSSSAAKRYYSRVKRFSGGTLETRATDFANDGPIVRETWESRRAAAAERRLGIAGRTGSGEVREYTSVRESIEPEDYENRRVIRVLTRVGEGSGTTGSRSTISVRDREIARTAWEKRMSIREKLLTGSGAATSVRATNYRDSEEIVRETWTPRVRARGSSSSSSTSSQ